VNGVPPMAERPEARLDDISLCPNSDVWPATGHEAAPMPSSPNDEAGGDGLAMGVGIECKVGMVGGEFCRVALGCTCGEVW